MTQLAIVRLAVSSTCTDSWYSPVEGVVYVGEDMQEVHRVDISKTVANSVHDGKHQVETEQNIHLKLSIMMIFVRCEFTTSF